MANRRMTSAGNAQISTVGEVHADGHLCYETLCGYVDTRNVYEWTDAPVDCPGCRQAVRELKRILRGIKVVSCTGHCCERFNLTGLGKEGDFERFREVVQANPGEPIRMAHPNGAHSIIGADDAAMMADMLIPLGLGLGPHDPPDTPPAMYYTCRHFDAETRLCTVYERRPRFCRTYGEEWACEHGCGMGCGKYEPDGVTDAG